MGSSQSIDTTHVVLPSQVVPTGGGEVDKSDDALERIFRQIDIDGSGCIDERELKKAVARMYGRGLGGDIVKNMMKAGDVNADGLVDLNEFKAIMRAGPAQSARILTKVTLKGVDQQRRHEEALARARKLRFDKLDQIDEARHEGNVDNPRNGMRNLEEWILRSSGRDLSPSPSPSYRYRGISPPPSYRGTRRQTVEPEAASKVAAALCQLLGRQVAQSASRCIGIPH